MKSFCYERSFDNRWTPIFYGDYIKPCPRETKNDRTSIYQVDDDLTLAEASLLYPAPIDPVPSIVERTIISYGTE